MPDNAEVKPRPVGEEPDSKPADRETAEPAIKKPNEPGLDREGNPDTGEPSIEPVDEVSGGR